MQQLSLLGPLDAVGSEIKFIILGLAVLNLGTRFLAHRHHVDQASSGGAEEMSRHPIHEATNVLLLLGAFLMTVTVEYHGGVVLSVLVVGMVITDFFEFEARKVEARNGDPIDKPKGAVVASMFVLGYAAFQALFFIVEGLVGRVIVL